MAIHVDEVESWGVFQASYDALLKNRFQPVVFTMEYAIVISMAMTSLVSSCSTSGVNSAFRLNSAEQRSGPKVVNDWGTALFLGQRTSLSVFHFFGKIVWKIYAYIHLVWYLCTSNSLLLFCWMLHTTFLVPGYQCKLNCFEVPQDFQPLCNTHLTHSKQNRRTGFRWCCKIGWSVGYWDAMPLWWAEERPWQVMLTHPGSRQGSKENPSRDGGKETSKEGNAATGWWIDLIVNSMFLEHLV